MITSQRARNLMFIWLGICLVFWLVYMITQEFDWTFVYFYLWPIGIGGLYWFNRVRLEQRWKAWSRPEWQKFMLLGYMMVLAEEVLAASFNHLNEGFSFFLWIGRIGQFWAFNLFAFTGYFVGWYLLLKRFHYSPRERYYLGGCWGLFSEKIYLFAVVNPLAAFLFAPLVIFTYGLIISPAMLSQERLGTRQSPRLVRWILTFVVPFGCSIPPMIVLLVLRKNFPWMFPPCDFISCE